MLNIFRIVSFLEGISYLLLMFIGLPFKYLDNLGNDPSYVKFFGMPHGLLFITYIVLAIMLKYELNWSNKNFIIICFLSIIPFGTFFIGKYTNSKN